MACSLVWIQGGWWICSTPLSALSSMAYIFNPTYRFSGWGSSSLIASCRWMFGCYGSECQRYVHPSTLFMNAIYEIFIMGCLHYFIIVKFIKLTLYMHLIDALFILLWHNLLFKRCWPLERSTHNVSFPFRLHLGLTRIHVRTVCFDHLKWICPAAAMELEINYELMDNVESSIHCGIFSLIERFLHVIGSWLDFLKQYRW